MNGDMVIIGNVRMHNMDCMELLKATPDKFYDLAIVDPPYGGGCNAAIGGHFEKYDGLVEGGSKWESMPKSRFGGGNFDKYKIERTVGTLAEKYGSKVSHWDVAPNQAYFDELARVSKNQIIWGGNYFDLPPTRCFLIWKKLSISEKFTMAMCEYAWTSFDANAKIFEAAPQGKKGDDRFHPTQKPIALYEWLLTNYAKQGDKILDTHLGSGSHAIACNNLGFELTATELDEDYFMASVKRISDAYMQVRMFSEPPPPKPAPQSQNLFE